MGETVNAGLLIAGTTIGAGILALPSATFASGLLPSSVIMLIAWLFTLQAGLLIAEATQVVALRTGRLGLGFVATIGEILGKGSERVATVAFAFVCYTMMVAYVAHGGVLLGPALGRLPVPPAAIFASGLGLLLTFGSPQVVDAFNNAFVAGVVVTFVAIIVIGVPHVQAANFGHHDWSAAPAALPISVLSLVYHTVVPHVVEKLEGNARLVCLALLGGSLLPLVMFIIWNAVVLGSVPASSKQLNDPLAFLRTGSSSHALGTTVSLFSQFAIVTSAIGFYLGLRSFLVDIFRLGPANKHDLHHRLIVTFGVLGIPLVVALLKPNSFLVALDLAGCFGVTILFGFLPVIAVWAMRCRAPPLGKTTAIRTPGGNLALLLQLALSAFIMGDGVVRIVGS